MNYPSSSQYWNWYHTAINILFEVFKHITVISEGGKAGMNKTVWPDRRPRNQAG
jgi:hypothetical protein